MKKVLVALLLLPVMALGLAGCQATEESQTQGATDAAGPIKIVIVETSAPAMETAKELLKDTLDVEIVLVDKNVDAIRAVQDGSADGALAVHKRFMESFNEENNGTLVMMQPYSWHTPIGLYSDKYDSVEALPKGAQIGIANDAMNMDRGLRMLADEGIIGLKDGVTGTYTILDIDDNPKEFEFIDMDQVQTVRSLEDLDAVIVFYSHMANAGKDFSDYLVRDHAQEEYPAQIVVREEDVDTPWAKAIAEALRTDEVEDAINEAFGVGVQEFYE